MQTMTEGSTDERLDRLEERVDEGFAQVDQRFAQIDHRFVEVDHRFALVDQKLQEIDGRFNRMEDTIKSMQAEMNQRFDGVHRTMVQGLIGICGVIATGFAAMLGFVATQI